MGSTYSNMNIPLEERHGVRRIPPASDDDDEDAAARSSIGGCGDTSRGQRRFGSSKRACHGLLMSAAISAAASARAFLSSSLGGRSLAFQMPMAKSMPPNCAFLRTSRKFFSGLRFFPFSSLAGSGRFWYSGGGGSTRMSFLVSSISSAALAARRCSSRAISSRMNAGSSRQCTRRCRFLAPSPPGPESPRRARFVAAALRWSPYLHRERICAISLGWIIHGGAVSASTSHSIPLASMWRISARALALARAASLAAAEEGARAAWVRRLRSHSTYAAGEVILYI